jgi:hypothetical protein
MIRSVRKRVLGAPPTEIGTLIDGLAGAAPLTQRTALSGSTARSMTTASLIRAVRTDTAAIRTTGLSKSYGDLHRGINYARWIEYSFSASLMVVLIATFAGVTDLRALIAVAGANAAMILFGLLMERVNLGRERLDWLPFWLGCLAGAVPWVVIGISLVGSELDGSVPGFVWAIFVSLFLFFNSFAVNMWLQYRGIGPWRRYIFGEWGYLVLSLTAKSALAWQIYAGALAS